MPTGQPGDLSYLIDSDPNAIDNSALPVTPIEDLHITGLSPSVNISDYRLNVLGLVENPLVLTYEEIKDFPNVTEVVLLICPGTFVDNAEWTGVPVTYLLGQAGLEPDARSVTFKALDGFQQTMALGDVQREGVFLAYSVDGKTLPQAHGYPLRLIVKGKYGLYWLKWVTEVEIS